ncbi:MAG: hypothetical protein M1818_001785 [Claussenomyces sp. TS43310]|nr:MAG: hypothetical protein M1818_001785 [Claussenomyces sp. TS43310]
MTDLTLSPLMIKALRIAPLLVNTFTLQYSLDEHQFFLPFTKQPSADGPSALQPFVKKQVSSDDSDREAGKGYGQRAARVLPQYLSLFLKHGFPMITVGYPLNMTLAALNLLLPAAASSAAARSFRSTVPGKWYLAGLSLTVAHMLWGPKALNLLYEIQELDDAKRKGGRPSVAAMVEWLRLNAIRTFLADFTAWSCYLIGFLSSVDLL